MADEQWRIDAIGALHDTLYEIGVAQEKTVMVIITVSEADLLGEQPVSFYGNIRPGFLGPFIAHCSARLAESTAQVVSHG